MDKPEQQEWEVKAKAALDEIQKHALLCVDDNEEHIFNIGFHAAYIPLQSRISELEKALRKIKYFTEDSGYGDPGEIAAEALDKGKDTTCQ